MERGNSEEDRISILPESLIHHILSFMSITYAVQTCVLSKRWQYIWTSMPVLRFSNNYVCDWEASDDDFYEEPYFRTKGFLKFVDRVLKLRDNNSDIQRFELKCSNFHVSRRKIYEFIETAVNHNVQEVYIKTDPMYGFEIPPCLCTCESLTKLELKLRFDEGDGEYQNKFILPTEMSLPRLKSLCLKLNDLSFHDENLTNRFFSSFPCLESLIMEFGDGFINMNLNISLPKLEYLKFECWNFESYSEVKLHAPSLVSFVFNSYLSTSFTLESLPSLVNADIEIKIYIKDQWPPSNSEIHEGMEEFYAQRCMRFLRRFHRVKVLTLRNAFIKALGGSPGILDAQPPKFCNLQHLELETYLSRDCLCSIFYVLKISPNIESVSLQISKLNLYAFPVYPYCDEVKFNPENIGDYWDAGLSLSCMILHLKFVEIKGLRGWVNELKFLEILLKHAMVLEEVILNSYSTKSVILDSDSNEKDSRRKKQMKKFSEMLRKFPTVSKKIVILLNS
ncbi:hypothetical protein C5167_039912 [Papaver somniferum]|uniref:F-box domain-containing protein n=1 Tax=Papaver somniferum TaxID=3469 RepID=A0A4Y7IGZ8_PAPSO|nr:F-box/LRR-repeat protein At4g14103-like [Papaver somniferum]RZC46962.1 hypothetical protein C5167_039912 [Papaver somniferum]